MDDISISVELILPNQWLLCKICIADTMWAVFFPNCVETAGLAVLVLFKFNRVVPESRDPIILIIANHHTIWCHHLHICGGSSLCISSMCAAKRATLFHLSTHHITWKGGHKNIQISRDGCQNGKTGLFLLRCHRL